MRDFFNYIKGHKTLTILISIAIVIIIGVGFIWGLRGYSGLCYTLAVISGIIAYAGLSSKEGSGCLVFIIAGLVCTAFAFGGNAIAKYCEEKELVAEAEIAFKQLSDTPSEKECVLFVQKYSKSPHYDEVMSMYLHIVEADGIKSLHEFAEKYRFDNKYGEEAFRRVCQMCDSLYRIADAIGTIDGWKEYICKVPSDFVRDAEEKIKEIIDFEWNTDSKAWCQATKENTLPAYQKYMTMYPNGVHYSAADKKVIDFIVANIYASDHGELPTMDRIGYGGGYTSRIEVKNNTSYTLTLLYSGPDSKRLVLSPYQTNSILLKNGSYRVAASVSSSTVRSYAGAENLKGGDYSVEYYIVTSRY